MSVTAVNPLINPQTSRAASILPNNTLPQRLPKTAAKRPWGRPSKTLALHRRIYAAAAEAGCIVHTHSRSLVALSLAIPANEDRDDLLPPITPYFVMKVGRLPLLPYFRPGDVDLFETLRHQVGSTVVSSILAAGFNLDFFDDDALRRIGKLDRNNLILGLSRYRAVVLPGVQRIPLDTYRQLEQFVGTGGILLATRRTPQQPPGFRASDGEQIQVREITKRLFHGSYGSAFLLEDEAQLGPKLSSLVVPDVSLLSPTPEVGFVLLSLAISARS